MNTANKILLATALALTQAVLVNVALASNLATSLREIRVTDNTRWINVQSGESVRLRVDKGGRTYSVIVAFDENGRSSFDLAEVLPTNVVLPKRVTVYVASNPAYRGA